MSGLDIVAERLRREIERDLFSIGILARVFSRGKSEFSLRKKIGREPGKYRLGGKLIQDGVGIRVAVYFADDVAIAEELLKDRFEYLAADSSIDNIDESTFNVLRRNLIFRLSQEHGDEVSRGALGQLPLDTTFEVQLRSMLSEGWHEVEHDLRYKCKPFWQGHSDLNRALNGVFATLETSEWSMLKIFDDLALRHYRARNWAAMAHARLRIRADPELPEELSEFFTSDVAAAKYLFRLDRKYLLRELYKNRIVLPIKLSNFVFLWNHVAYKNDDLRRLAPPPILDMLSEIPNTEIPNKGVRFI